MTELQLEAGRQDLREMMRNRQGRLLIAIGISSGGEARELHHTLHGLLAQGVVPDYVGGFITFVSGYLCAASHGLPDLGYVLRSEIAQATDRVEQATWLAALDTGQSAFPIGADVDTGYGSEPSAVLLTCRQVHKQGAQYLQLEDQLHINKSCGHMAGALGTGKEVVSQEEMIASRLGPALSYAKAQADLSIMARTDVGASQGIDEAIRRGQAYADAGAHMVFVEAPRGQEELERVAAAFKGSPALSVANMIEASPLTPYKSPEQLHTLGFDLALYCIGSLLVSSEARKRYFASLGTGALPSQSYDPDLFASQNRVLGRAQTEAWNRLFRGES